MAIRIICIKKDNGNHENPYVAITSLNWINESTGNKGTISRIGLYDWIKDDKGVAYVKDNIGNRANILPMLSSAGNKYVKTQADSTTSDNLLKLPQCI